jgi:hypothetical protein
MTVQVNNMLHRTVLMGLIKERPDMSKDGFRQGYVGREIMPLKPVATRRLTWDVLYSENQLAGIYGPRGEAIPGDDLLYSKMFADVVDVKAKRLIDPEIAQFMLDPGTVAIMNMPDTGGYASQLRAKVNEEITRCMGWCDDVVDSTYEYFVWRALQGRIDWPPRDSDGNVIEFPMQHWNPEYQMSFSFPFRTGLNTNPVVMTGYKGNVGGQQFWDHAAADPIKDLETLNEYAAETYGLNLRGGTVWMSSSVLRLLSLNAEILNWVTGTNKEQQGARSYADEAAIRTLLQTSFGWNLRVYDAQWTYRTYTTGTRATVNRVRFLDRNKVVITPAGGLQAYMATAPLYDGNTWVYGKLPWSYQDPKPNFDTEVGVNTIMWPIMETMDHAVLQVLYQS